MLTETVGDQCDILCNLIIRENYLNDTDSEVVNSKLELFSNVYNGRILLADRDFKIVSDTFHTEEGKTLLSSLAVACLKEKRQAIMTPEVKYWSLQFLYRVRMCSSFRA